MHAAVGSHHTAWIHTDRDQHPVSVRYALDGETLIVFGDGVLRGLTSGTRAWVTVHEIAGGPPLVSFAATVTDLTAVTAPREALLELLEHVSLGPDLDTVNRRVDEIIHTRRIIGLTP